MSPTTRCWACNMGWFDSPELDCSCFERDSHWEMSRFSSLSPYHTILLGRWALTFLTTLRARRWRGPQQSANDDSLFFFFLFHIFTGSSSPFLTGDEGKTKQKKDPQIKLAGYTPTDLFVDCLSLPWGYYSTTAYSLFGTTLFLPWKEERAESESDDSTSSSTGFNKKKRQKNGCNYLGLDWQERFLPPRRCCCPPLATETFCGLLLTVSHLLARNIIKQKELLLCAGLPPVVVRKRDRVSML